MPKYYTQQQLENWARQQIDRGVPMQTLWKQVMDMREQSWPNIKSVANVMLNAMVERNNQAKELEKSGHIEQAIALLELNVRDLCNGTFPYNRLQIIYTKQKRYHDAIRICQAYIDNPHTGNNEISEEQIVKLQKKLE